MNIVYLHCHDAGRFVSPGGGPPVTPNLEAFARDAVVFRQAFCCAPTCSPSRAALLTGISAHESGMLGLVHRGFRLADPSRHLAARLRDTGILTALAGVQHELTAPQLPLAYEEALPHDGAPTASPDDFAVARWAAGFVRRRHGRPFFLSCGFTWPHREFPPADPDLEAAAFALPPRLPNDPTVRRDYAGFLTAVRRMDRAAGAVLEALADAGRMRDTLVLFTTDHGAPFPMGKCSLTDGGMGVALVIRPPVASRSATVDALVSHLEVAPTLFDYLGRPAPAWYQGSSLRPMIDGGTTPVRREVFAEINFHAAYEPARCVRTGRHKLIRYFDDDTSPRLSNIDASPTKEIWRTTNEARRPRDRIQLYDLVNDPLERDNLAESPAHAAIHEDLERRLRQWMTQTNDPLLDGPLVRPPGARVNAPESPSPVEGPYET